MSNYTNGLESVYPDGNANSQQLPNAGMINGLDGYRSQSVQLDLWAAAQSLALAKLKVFHTMAKSVNDMSSQ